MVQHSQLLQNPRSCQEGTRKTGKRGRHQNADRMIAVVLVDYCHCMHPFIDNNAENTFDLIENFTLEKITAVCLEKEGK